MAKISHSKKEARGNGAAAALDPALDQDMHEREGAAVNAPSTFIPMTREEKKRLLESYALTKLIAGRGTHWNRTET